MSSDKKNKTKTIFSCTRNIREQFDSKFYAKTYPDLFENGIISKDNLQIHWSCYGKKEGRIQSEAFLNRINNNFTVNLSAPPSPPDNNIKFYILIRTAFRPESFKKCIESIHNQTYRNLEIIVAIDDRRALSYVSEFKDCDYILTESNKSIPYAFNLNANQLVEYALDISSDNQCLNYGIFLDDDDIFSHPEALNNIAHQIHNLYDKNTVIVWQYYCGTKCIGPKLNTDISNINRGGIASCAYAFPLIEPITAKWTARRGGDYDFFRGLFTKPLGLYIIPESPFTRAIESASYGRIDSLDINLEHVTRQQLSPAVLNQIFANIDYVNNVISKFTRILIFCNDTAGDGGAAVNCNALYHLWNTSISEVHVAYEACIDKFKNKSFDLIILKSPTDVKALRQQFPGATIIFLIPGLYHIWLDRKPALMSDYAINKDTIITAKEVDLCMCNSAHTRDILLNQFDIFSRMFYSSFVPFLYQTLPDINSDYKWRYGIIASDLTKPIKNFKSCYEYVIKHMKNNERCIICGKGTDIIAEELAIPHSDQIDWIPSPVSVDDLPEIYANIRTVVCSSFYESCSNVRVEAIFYGCEIVDAGDDVS